MRSLTVSELAALVAEPESGDDTALVRRQIRHWSAMGLLPPAGSVFVGTGRERQYLPETAYRAALLVRLSALGLLVGPLKAIADRVDRALTEDADAERFWRAAIEGSEAIRFGARIERRSGAEDIEQAVIIIEPAAGGPAVRVWRLPTVWVDLSGLFQGVRQRLYQ